MAGWMADAYLRRLYARFDLVMAPSRSIAERVRQRGVKNVVIQPLGVDGEIFRPGARDPDLRTAAISSMTRHSSRRSNNAFAAATKSRCTDIRITTTRRVRKIRGNGFAGA
jgi:glycosyltransferase involved in cell wall biosynthesis